jgi:hypothetical protein
MYKINKKNSMVNAMGNKENCGSTEATIEEKFGIIKNKKKMKKNEREI